MIDRVFSHLLALLAGVLFAGLVMVIGMQLAHSQPVDAASPAMMDAASTAPNVPQAIETYRAAPGGSAAKTLALFALLAAAIKGLVDVLKKHTPMGGDKAKKWLPLVAVALGVPAAILSQKALGVTWGGALMYAAGAASVFVNELANVFKKAPA